MTRKNLTSLIILDIIVMALAIGLMAYRYQALSSVPLSAMTQNVKPAVQAEALKPLPEEPSIAEDEMTGEEEARAVIAEVTKPVIRTKASKAAAAKAKAAAKNARNICFTYKNSTAKKVEIIGDFTDWIPKKMTKGAASTWKITLALAPGDYSYNFVVNGRPKRDPNNPKVSNAGRGFANSFLKVSPLSNDNKKSK